VSKKKDETPEGEVQVEPDTSPTSEEIVTVDESGVVEDIERPEPSDRLFEPADDDRAQNVLLALKRDAAEARDKAEKAADKADDLATLASKAERVLADYLSLRGGVVGAVTVEASVGIAELDGTTTSGENPAPQGEGEPDAAFVPVEEDDGEGENGGVPLPDGEPLMK
jgi:hypothetical protein